MDYSLHAYVESNTYSTDMDYPSKNQALFALVVMIIVLLFILVYCCSGAFPCSSSNNTDENVINLDPTGRRIRYPLVARARRQSPVNDQDASRDRSSSRRSAVVIVPVNGLMYCCDDNADRSLTDSMRSKPPAYGDLFNAPPPYSLRTKTPSSTPENESVFPPTYEDSFKDWKLTFDNDNRFDMLHQSAAAEAQPVASRRLSDLINGATSSSSESNANNLTSHFINVLSPDYKPPCSIEATATTIGPSRATTHSSTDSRNTSHMLSRNEHPSQRGLEVGAFSSHTSHSADDLNNRISSLNEPPVAVNFHSRLSAEPDPVYTGADRRPPRGSSVHGSHKFSRSASTNLPDDSSYYSNNDFVVSEQQRWSTGGNRGSDMSEQQSRSTVGNRDSNEVAPQKRPKVGSGEAFRHKIKFSECSRNMEESEQQYLSKGRSQFQQHQQLTGRNWLRDSSDYRKQISETNLNNLTSASHRRNPDTEITHHSDGYFNYLETANDKPIFMNVPLNDLNSRDHDCSIRFSSSPMNITDNNEAGMGLACSMHAESQAHKGRTPHDSQNLIFTMPLAQKTDHSIHHSENHSHSSSDLYLTNNQQSLDPSRGNFHGRNHASSVFSNPGTVSAETSTEFQKEPPKRNGTKVLPARVPDSDVYSLIRDLTAAENQRKEQPILDRTKSCDSVDQQFV
ncbi:hypothetical protein FHG87_020823 [Trinorchestia longiramus]|nr:hypothetical protein FHG87_020823 [Trinorchestia longiramus]